MNDIEYDVFVEPPASGQAGEISIHVDDGFYIAAIYGPRRAMRDYLKEQEFVGIARYVAHLKKDRIAYISGMEVPRHLRRQGHGSALLRATLEELRKKKVQTVVLHASPSTGVKQEDLDAFYGRHGFEPVDVWGDVWPVMRLDLQ